MGLLTREAILQADDLPRELVDVPEWGGAVYVRALMGEERDDYESQCLEKRGNGYETNLKNVRAKLCALAICDEKGTTVFSEADVMAIGRKSASALDKVFHVAQRLSGLSQKDMEELEGN